MKKIIGSIVGGAVVGAYIGFIKDIFENKDNRNSTVKNVLGGAAVGAILGGNIASYISVKNFKKELTKEVKEDLKKELMNQVDFEVLRKRVELDFVNETNKAIKEMNTKADKKINKTIAKINKQNLIELEAETKTRLDNIETKVNNIKPSIVFATPGKETSKNDIIMEAINSGNYDGYDLRKIINTINEM